MSEIRFWLGMNHRGASKRADKLLIGNIDTGEAAFIDLSELLAALTADDLPEGANRKYITAEQKTKLENLAEGILTLQTAAEYFYPKGTNPSGYLTASSEIYASKVKGTIPASQIPELDASKIVSGLLSAARVPDLPASKITSGTLSVDRLPLIPADKIGGFALDLAKYIAKTAIGAANGVAPLDANVKVPVGYIPNLDAAQITTGKFAEDRIPDVFLKNSALDNYYSKEETQAFTSDEKIKLAGLDDQKWKGGYPTKDLLLADFPEGDGQAWHKGEGGWEADVDGGPGQPVQRYLWDATDLIWVLQAGSGGTDTPAQVKIKYESNPDTNALTDIRRDKIDNLPAFVESTLGAQQKADAAKEAANIHTDNAALVLHHKLDEVALNFNFNNINIPYNSEPIVPTGEAGEFDENIRELGNVIIDDELQKSILVYSGRSASSADVFIGLATKDYGSNLWVKQGQIISTLSEDPYLVKSGAEYHLYVEKREGSSTHLGVEKWTSTDLATWSSQGLVLEAGASGSWDDQDVSSPTLFLKNGVVYMFYEGRSLNGVQKGAIGLATSTDNGVTFEKYGEDGLLFSGTQINGDCQWSKTEVVPDDIITIGGKYYLFFHAATNGTYHEGVAVSEDLLVWRDYLQTWLTISGGFGYNNYANDGELPSIANRNLTDNTGNGIMLYKEDGVIKSVHCRDSVGIFQGEFNIRNAERWDYSSKTTANIKTGSKHEFIEANITSDTTFILESDLSSVSGFNKIIENNSDFILTIEGGDGVTIDGGISVQVPAKNTLWLVSSNIDTWRKVKISGGIIDESNILHKTGDEKKEGKLTLLGELKVIGLSEQAAVYNIENNIIRVSYPQGGVFSTTDGNSTGALKISLPVNNWTMIKMVVDIFDYDQSASLSILISGYVDSGAWSRQTAQVISSKSNRDLKIRFGADGDIPCVWIGETDTSWKYLQVAVRDFMGSYQGVSKAWASGWIISLVTQFNAVKAVLENNLPYADFNKMKNKPIGASGSFLSSDNKTVTVDNGLIISIS